MSEALRLIMAGKGAGANLQEVSLQGANLRGADLQGADLRRTNLRGADLQGANLGKADLRGADLQYTSLTEADLTRANLRLANLTGTDLSSANLQEANLRYTSLQGADLQRANLRGASLPHFQIVPSEGSFVAWKKTTTGVVKLLIPEHAKRTSTLVGRKCRASSAIVLEGLDGVSPSHEDRLEYILGMEVVADGFDDDIRIECTNGIHFFMTKEEAQQWCV